MPKIVLIGAGSYYFAKAIISDILSYHELRDSTISLMDIAQEPLDLITTFGQKLVKQHGFKTHLESTIDRQEALKGADYVIVAIRVGGLEATLADQETVAKYGISEGVGDTLGPSGVFHGLRHVPVMLDICRDMEELCPDAWLINYANPMAIICWALNEYTHIKNVGLCHSVQHTSAELLRYLGVPIKTVDLPEGADPYYQIFQNQEHEELKDLTYWVAGINHMAWFLEFKWRGEDAYPLLKERFKDPTVYSGPDAHWGGPDDVRVEIFKAFGYFVSEGSPHMSDYVPYFRKRPELIKKFNLPGSTTRVSIRQMRMEQYAEFKQQVKSNHEFPIIRSVDYGITVIHSLETGTPSRINGNVRNNNLVTNLPAGCCVEVPCLIDRDGIHPCYVGDLPPQLAALNRTNINVQEMAVRGIVEKDKTKIFQSILLDPLTSAILTIVETRRMVDELFQVGAEYLKGYK
jgi:alpha-galactosidase